MPARNKSRYTELYPLDAPPGDILEFTGRYAFLSNFKMCTIPYNGIMFPSVEHAYQAQKNLSEEIQRYIAYLDTPNNAKKYAQTIPLREDWEEVKVPIMSKLVYIKFHRHRDLQKALLATGDVQLVEGNWWGDTFWGMVNGQGHNVLGRILMQCRRDLRFKREISGV